VDYDSLYNRLGEDTTCMVVKSVVRWRWRGGKNEKIYVGDKDLASTTVGLRHEVQEVQTLVEAVTN
jgi:hypothetical protein